jgi:hypothetical protein
LYQSIASRKKSAMVCSTKETPCSISVFGDGLHASCCIHRAHALRSIQFRWLRSLLLLTLPLEAESLVDPEFPAEGEEGHDDGNAIRYVRPPYPRPRIARKGDLPKDDNCEKSQQAFSCILHSGRDVLKGQISVGMFLSWRRRWEAVWAVASSIRVLWCPCSANWLTALLVLLLTPLASVLQACGGVERRTGTGLRICSVWRTKSWGL